jgi:hypothetical protein
MTPEAYLQQVGRLAEKGAFAELMAFSDEHLSDEMLDAMTPQQRRDVHSVLHIAAPFVGEGPLDPPRGIPVDDLEDDLVEASPDDGASRVRIV